MHPDELHQVSRVGERHDAVVTYAVNPDDAAHRVHSVGHIPKPVLVLAEVLCDATDGEDGLDSVDVRRAEDVDVSDVQFHGSNWCRQLCGMSAMRAKASASHAFGSMLLRRAGMMSVIRREVPNRTFNDWDSPRPGFCEVDMVAPGGTSVAGSSSRP